MGYLSRAGIAAGVAVAATATFLGAPTMAEAVRGEAAADLPPFAVETFDYPRSDEILAEHGVLLERGDGRIVADLECATEPDEDGVGAMRVRYTVESGGARTLCLVVRGDSGRIDLRVPNVFSIRGDGYETGVGHDFTAVVDTPSDDPVEITGDGDSYTPVGIGADPDSEPTVLLQITV
ncbi:hypothetical protein [Myceligenerans salitolerans]|uniref:Secreted protein n=1 Tax=Myceligenerans salitolerans TaxID=1230528 RepID=A0ABS3ICA7_9MICO|nr:hypothetical protein [Myceligenerans salitolerans]MBO0610078.1 hypothetical protein [Myceligenerans salitolerans]